MPCANRSFFPTCLLPCTVQDARMADIRLASLVYLPCLRLHVLRAYCTFASKQAVSITLFGPRPNKKSGWKFQIPCAQWNDTFLLHRPDPSHRALYAEQRRGVVGTAMLSNGEEHFGLTGRNDRTGQSGPRPWSQISRSHKTKMPCSN